MKKAFALLMAFVLLLFASACGKKNESVGDINTEAALSSSVNSRETTQTDNDADALTEDKETTTDDEEGMDAATQEGFLATNISANLDNGDLLQEIESDFERTTSLLKDKLEETYEAVGESYSDYVNNVHFISEWYALVQEKSEELYARTRTNSEDYYRQIFSDTNQAQDTDAFEEAMDAYSDRIYDTAFENYYDVIYEGAFEELYEKYYEGILDEQPSEVSFSDYLEVHSGFFGDWLDAHSTFFGDWLDAHSDLFSLYLDVSGAKWDDDFDLEALLKREEIDAIEKGDGESGEVGITLEITDTSDGLRPEFKEAMDAYEAFYDEYCEFMKEYKENPTNLSLLGKYADFLEQVDEMDEKFDAWDGDTLNDAEMKYYWEVYSRVMQKLTSVYS